MKTTRKRKRRREVPSAGRGKQARHTPPSPSSGGGGGGGGRAPGGGAGGGGRAPGGGAGGGGRAPGRGAGRAPGRGAVGGGRGARLPDPGAGEVQEAPPPSFPVPDQTSTGSGHQPYLLFAEIAPPPGLQAFGSFQIPPPPDGSTPSSGSGHQERQQHMLSAEIAPPPGLQTLGSFQIPPPDGSASPSAQKSRSNSSSSSMKCRLRNKKGSPPPVSVAPNSPSSSSSSSTSYHTVTGKHKNKHHDITELVQKYLKSAGSHLVKEMWEQQTFVMRIGYFALRRADNPDRKAADKLCNQMSKTLQAVVEDAARHVVVELFKKEEYKQRFSNEEILASTVFEKFELEILNLPSSISSLESIICKLRGHALRTLFKGHSFRQDVVDMHEELRLLLDCCLHKLLQSHRNGHSWSGQWNIGDWYVLNDGKVEFEVAPVMYKDHDELLTACKADLKIFATSIISLFAIAGSFPAYLQHLSDELSIEAQKMTYDDYFGSEKERESWVYYFGNGWYMEYLEFHPALLSALARLMLIAGWYVCINDLQYENWAEFKGTICAPLDWMDVIAKKREDEVDKLKWLTFWYQAKKPNPLDSSTWKSQYINTWAKKHLFLRHLCFHSYRHTKLTGGLQTAENEDEPELNAARLEPMFFPDFVKLLLSERKMTEGFFRHWKVYRKQKFDW